jgi:4-hydroxy-tetrahydrodipicolinate reductase
MNRERLSVGVNGCKGKMGSEVVRAVRAAEDLALVFETDLGDDLSEAIRTTRAAVVVDFTRPESALANTLAILGAAASPVVGTTGFSDSDLSVVRARCESVGRGAVIAPNFALGAVLLMRFAEQAARHLLACEIIELHHDRKLDSPSGTALATAQRIASARTGPVPDRGSGATASASASRGERREGVAIHSVRLPGLVAHQEVLFGSPGQLLTLRHDVTSREAFMPGVLLAVRRVPGIRRLVHGLEALLE